MNPKIDYYQTLGVSRSVEPQQLKAAYRTLALRYHPDQNPDDREAEEKFKQISEAYAVLSDPQLKKQYDRSRLLELLPPVGPASFDQGIQQVKRFFGTLLKEFKQTQPEKKPGRDLRYEIELTLEESSKKVDKVISFPVEADCPVCEGTGTKEGRLGWRMCIACEGEGVVKNKAGKTSSKLPCHSCHGTGRTIISPCAHCQGLGHVKKWKELRVLLPSGLKDGEVRKIAQRGEPGQNGGQNGDLWIVVRIRPHSLLHRENDHSVCDVPITLSQAILGGKVMVPTLDQNPVELTIPPGILSGTILRVRDKGFPINADSSQRGDAYYRILIEAPIKLSEEQLVAVRKLSEALGSENYPHQAEFLEKVKGVSK